MPKGKRRSRKSRRKSFFSFKLSHKTKRRLRVLSMAVGVVISTAVVFSVIALWQFLRTPFVEASGVGSVDQEFRGDRRYNVLLTQIEDLDNDVSHIEKLSILSIDPVDGGLSLITVPVDAEVERRNSEGELKISTLYALGEVGKAKDHINLVKKEISNTLAVPIDKYVLTDKEGFESFEESAGTALKWENYGAVFSAKNLTKFIPMVGAFRAHVRTDFTVSELTRLMKFLVLVRSDKLNYFALTQAYLDDLPVLDQRIQPFVLDKHLFGERLSAQVFNGTTVPGFAGNTARYIENLGGRVVGVGNAPQSNHEKSFILARDVEAYSVKRLAEVFGIKEVRKYDPAYGIRNRADISIVLGFDISERF